jgi:hypothetical protein
MPLDRAALKAEIQADPLGIGYGPHAAAQDDAAVAGLLNARTGPGAGTIALDYVSRDDFLKGIRPALLRLPAEDANIQAKWDRILSLIATGPGVTIDDETRALLDSAVTDGILTQAEADAVWHRTGSRAEVLFGPGAVVTPAEVSVALRGKV